MSLPQVIIIQGSGGLARTTAIDDSVCGLIVSGAAVAGKVTLGEAYMLTSPDDIATLGIVAASNPEAYQHLNDFYSHVPEGTQLWLMVIPDTVVLADLADKTKAYAPKLLDAAAGSIKLLAITRKPAAGYVPTIVENLDQDVITALTKLKELKDDYAAKHMPFSAILPGLGFTAASVDASKNLRELTVNTASIVSFSSRSTGQPSVGLVLGKLASVAVQHSIGAVKDGDIGINDSYYPDGSTYLSLLSKLEALHDKGYILSRKYVGKSGYYLTGDPVCAPTSNDINRIGLQRVYDKASRIAYNVYIDALLDDIEVDSATGKLPASVCAYYESLVENAIKQLMQNEISGVKAIIDVNQNIIKTGKFAIKLRIVPLGLIESIEINLGFTTSI